MSDTPFHVESTLPRPWQEEHSFNDTLYDWMNRAPWLAISGAMHLLAYFVLAAVPWATFGREPKKAFDTEVLQAPEEVFEEPPEEEPDEIREVEIEEPVLVDSDVVEEPLENVEAADTPADFLDPFFDPVANNDVIGIGNGGSTKLGRRFGPRGPRAGGEGTEKALVAALEWLAHHQDPEGFWDGDGFSARCGTLGATVCDGAGSATHDVGLTGLALLAYLGDGNTTNEGRYKELVQRGVDWLRRQQDVDSGLIGHGTSQDFVYDHAIATLALCEAYYFSKNPIHKRTAEKAVDYIHHARNPYGAWRYDVPPIGDNDTSITGWMLFALTSAKEAGLVVDEEAIHGGLSWIDEVTDPNTGRVGYNGPGTLSSRTPANQLYDRNKGEAMTAVGMLCRIFAGHGEGARLGGERILERHAELLAKKLPAWDEEGFGCDMYYWYYGTYAMFQVGGDHWKKWNAAMKDAVLRHQRDSGDEKGSWDPVGPWGYSGGRVYSTALMTLSIEVYFRYGRVLGAR